MSAADTSTPSTGTGQVTLVVLSPEVELLNTQCDFVALPAAEGEIGILPKHAPLVARLGAGELRVRKGAVVSRYYVSGGYVQVRRDEVYVLTEKAVDAARLDKTKLAAELARATALVATTVESHAARRKAIESAQTQIAIRDKAGA